MKERDEADSKHSILQRKLSGWKTVDGVEIRRNIMLLIHLNSSFKIILTLD